MNRYISIAIIIISCLFGGPILKGGVGVMGPYEYKGFIVNSLDHYNNEGQLVFWISIDNVSDSLRSTNVITIPDSIPNIAFATMFGGPTFNSPVEEMAERALQGCNMRSLKFECKKIRICCEFCIDCHNLEEVDLSNAEAYLATGPYPSFHGCFEGCTNLKTIKFGKAYIYANAFQGANFNTLLLGNYTQLNIEDYVPTATNRVTIRGYFNGKSSPGKSLEIKDLNNGTTLLFEKYAARYVHDIVCHETTPPAIDDRAFELKEGDDVHITEKGLLLYVPRAAIEAYKSAPGWSKIAHIYAIEDGVEAIETDIADTPAEYYNLQGQRITNPTPGTTVIRRQGTSVTKVVAK